MRYRFFVKIKIMTSHLISKKEQSQHFPILSAHFSDMWENVLQENRLMYMLRNFDSLEKKFDKKAVEAEFLKLFTDYQWDYFAQDIDRNILLTYPIVCKINSVIGFLLDSSTHNISEASTHQENKAPVYDLSEYGTLVSNALTASVLPHNLTIYQNLLSCPNIHPQYLEDLSIMALIRRNFSPKYQEFLHLIPQEKVATPRFLQKCFEAQLREPGLHLLEMIYAEWNWSLATKKSLIQALIVPEAQQFSKNTQEQLKKLTILNEKITLEENLSNPKKTVSFLHKI